MQEHKLSADLRQQIAARAAGPIPVIIRYSKESGEAISRTLVTQEVSVRYTYHLVPAIAGSMNMAQISALSDDPRIERIWFDRPVYTCLDISVPLIGTPQVWAAGPTGRGITVAVVDTGVDTAHPDLAGRVIKTHDFTGEGYNDGHGHGTHVAGIIGGNGAASNGKYKGVAPEVTLIAAKVLRANGSGATSDVMAGVEWAVQERAKVINLSLGSPGACDGSDALSELCDAATDQGVVVCVAAGNEGPSPSTVGSPGCARKVITVGASNDQDGVTDFSSRGPTADGRVKPDVCYPGYKIISCRASGTSMGRVVDERYTEASGTSMATPHASGAAALLRQAYPSLPPDQIKTLMMVTAKNLGLNPNTQGAGRADLWKAYQAGAGPIPTPTPEPTPTPTPPGPTPQPGGCLPTFLRRFVGQ